MTCDLFRTWFYDEFVPFVRKELPKMKEEPKAVLLLDNCSAHPEAFDLTSSDGKIFAYFLPANVTSPVDQGVLKTIKLIRRLIIEDNVRKSIIEFIKSVNMKTVVEFVAESWNETQPLTLRRSWRKILQWTIHPNKQNLFAMGYPLY